MIFEKKSLTFFDSAKISASVYTFSLLSFLQEMNNVTANNISANFKIVFFMRYLSYISIIARFF
ncbi:MAG: hypothetical protein CO117_00505 [Flavobacteriaceae bacterium CG_4_9_14_3_um_filter_33_16]|nr:MAG: hypothetical protein CO117_00505 [Flavobacteriaceae bacterium CG_4_9_14_3_um_filter_33_16]